MKPIRIDVRVGAVRLTIRVADDGAASAAASAARSAEPPPPAIPSWRLDPDLGPAHRTAMMVATPVPQTVRSLFARTDYEDYAYFCRIVRQLIDKGYLARGKCGDYTPAPAGTTASPQT